MNKKIKKTLMSILGLTAVVVPTSMVLTSCGNGNSSIGFSTYAIVNTKKSQKTTTTESVVDGNNSIVLNPNINDSAINNLDNLMTSKLNFENLKNDFNRIISKFYNVYEYEDKNIEAEIKKIDLQELGQWDSTNGKIKNIKVKVTYEVENDKRDNEILETQDKTLDLEPTFATYNEIENLIKKLKAAKNQKAETIDLGDIYELYVGDPDDNEDSIFDRVINQMDQNGKNGGFVGWGLKLGELKYTSSTSPKEDVDAKSVSTIFAPSLFLNTTFIPNDGNNITLKPDSNGSGGSNGGGSTNTPDQGGDNTNTTPTTPQKIDLSLKFNTNGTIDMSYDELSNNSITSFDKIQNIFNDGTNLATVVDAIKITAKTINANESVSNGSSFVSKDLLTEDSIIIDIKFKGTLNTTSISTKDLKVASVCIPKSWCKDSSIMPKK